MIRTRAEDFSLLDKLAYAKQKYWFIWMSGGAVVIAMGFGWKTPAQTTEHLQTEIDTLVARQQRVEKQQQIYINTVISVAKLACLSSKIPEHDLRLVGVDCDKILSQ